MDPEIVSAKGVCVWSEPKSLPTARHPEGSGQDSAVNDEYGLAAGRESEPAIHVEPDNDSDKESSA